MVRTDEHEEEKTSKFSSGINILKRIDTLWKRTHFCIENNLYSKWNTILDIIWLELARDLKLEDYKDKKDKEGNVIIGKESQFNEFDKQLAKQGSFDDVGGSGFAPPTKEMRDKRNKQYEILKDKQKFLARLENELGKGTSWGESEDDWD